MLRRVILAGLSACVLGLTFGFSQTANARPQNPTGNDCWIDAATGKPVRLVPAGLRSGFDQLEAVNSGRAHIPGTGQNVNQDSNGNWIDSATGQPVNTVPAGMRSGFDQLEAVNGGRAHIAGTGQNVVRVPCPPPATQTSGLYLGGELIKNSGRVRTTETSAATGAITNQFSDSGDPIGAGIVAGYNFRPWNNNIILGPFASFDFLNQTINHNFAGGQFLGTTTHWIATVGAKGGYIVTPGLYLYGLAGASWLNQSLNVNFATAASSNTTTPGFTLGLGGEYQPSSWRLFGNPVSVFLQYQHTWWGTANFNTPTSSPGFNYAFKREDDTIRLGVNVYLSR